MEQRFTFNAIASLYDAVRPTYPDALFDDVVAAAGLAPGEAMLEVGCGAGQATQGFAKRGLRILALDPGPAMLEAARKRLAGFANVRFVETTFEAWPPALAAFKLVAAAQSWHWVARDVGFAKAAATLQPGGALAVFGNVAMPIAAPLGEALAAVHAHHAPHLSGPAPERSYLAGGPIEKLFEGASGFAAPTHRSYPWTRRFDAPDYADLLRTKSDYQLLEPARRDELLAAVAQAVEAHGGQFELLYEAHLYVAKRS
jgi:SAM-dependent methyltransferase